MRLPPELVVEAARVAVDIYPGNRPPLQQFATLVDGVGSDDIYPPLRIAAMTDKYWGPKPRTLTLQSLDGMNAATKRLVLEYANAWDCGVRFAWTEGEGDVRIARDRSGYWSYLGTDIKLLRAGAATMNLQGFTERTSIAEYQRVCIHEFGHTLGFPHEHMRDELVAQLDREKTVAYFGRTQGWSRRDVELQVLTPLDRTSVMGTPPDATSIMCYMLPGEITKNGIPIPGGDALNATDLKFADDIYPLASSPPPVGPPDPPVKPTPPVDPEPVEPVDPETPPGIPLVVGGMAGPFAYRPKEGPLVFRFDREKAGVHEVEVPGEIRWAFRVLDPSGKPVATELRSDRRTNRVAFRAKVPGTYVVEVARKVKQFSGTVSTIVVKKVAR